jgi:hypothetical protein
MIDAIFAYGIPFIVGCVGGSVLFTKVTKPKAIKKPDNGYDGASYKFQSCSDHRCPKCNRGLSNEVSYLKFCECAEYHSDHFHIVCKGQYESGCGYKFIMRTHS